MCKSACDILIAGDVLEKKADMIREEAELKAVTQTFHYQTKRELRVQNGCEKRGPDNLETKRNSRGGEKARDGLVASQSESLSANSES